MRQTRNRVVTMAWLEAYAKGVLRSTIWTLQKMRPPEDLIDRMRLQGSLDDMRQAVNVIEEGCKVPEPAANSECSYCTTSLNESIRCHGCGDFIEHRDGYSIAHHCSACNIENGKGE